MSFFRRDKNNKNITDKELILDQVLYEMPDTGTKITYADSLEGCFICGANGSGKSSGPANYIAKAMLRNGYGFLVLCAKVDEVERWKKYVKETGREQDLVIFNSQSGLYFNFLEYEMNNSGEVLNLNQMLMNLNEQSKVFNADSAGNSERFWDNAVQRLISRTISFLKIAGKEISISNIRQLITDSLQEEDVQYYNLLKKLILSSEKIEPQKRAQARADFDMLCRSNFFVRTYESIRVSKTTEANPDELQLLDTYWMKEFANLSEKTRSIITESFMGIIEPFLNKGILKTHFAQGLSSELLPENIITNNKIVIMDFPVKQYGLAGVYAATIYKTAFQQAMERRRVDSENNPKPVALFIDEYHTFCNPTMDSLFQLTARSSWVATIYITQNINNLNFVMGNNQPQARAKSLLGNLNLKIFASNADFDTNEWASKMIGKHYIDVQSINFDKEMHISKSKSKELRDKVPPDDFTKLKTGRKANKYIVEAVVFKSGKVWGKDGDNYAVVKFDQRK